MKTITASLDAASIDNAIKAIEEYEKDFLRKCDEFTRQLAEFGGKAAGTIFGEAVQMSVVKEKDYVYSINANGERVCFLEFGTGVYADSSHPFAPTSGIDIYPGSWSDVYGAGKWHQWVYEWHKNPNEFPYNRVPRRALLKAYNAMVDNAGQLARRVFGA